MAVTERKSHVRRFYDENKTAWIDVEIIDSITIEKGRGSSYVKTVRKFEYTDGENPVREATMLKVYNPQDDTQFIKIPLTHKITTEAARGYSYRKRVHSFDNSEDNVVRQTHRKRVIHYGIDDEFLDGEGNPPRDPQTYLDAVTDSDDPDTGDYVDVAVIDTYTREKGRGRAYRKTVNTSDWLNDPLMAETEYEGRKVSALGPELDDDA